MNLQKTFSEALRKRYEIQGTDVETYRQGTSNIHLET